MKESSHNFFVAENSHFSDVRPVSPVAGYVGGKRLLAKSIIPRIDAIPHVTYAEPFVGMGGIFLRRSRVPKSEVINDLNGEVATFFRILQRHYTAFMDMLRYQLTMRREFERLKATDPATLTDLERAARFLYLQRTAFGGKVSGQNFGVDVRGGGSFNVSRLGPLLEELHERLAGVVIENLTWQDFIDRYNRPGTLFYLDPPYYGSEGYYGKELFQRSQFEEMAERLERLQGSFLLSLNDCPEVRRIFKRFAIERLDTSYTLAGHGRKKDVGEVLISASQ